MFVALSCFTIANGMSAEVQAAFREPISSTTLRDFWAWTS